VGLGARALAPSEAGGLLGTFGRSGAVVESPAGAERYSPVADLVADLMQALLEFALMIPEKLGEMLRRARRRVRSLLRRRT
jgi:hypothetical protein